MFNTQADGRKNSSAEILAAGEHASEGEGPNQPSPEVWMSILTRRNQFELASELDSLRKYGRRSSHFRPPINRHLVKWRLLTCAQWIGQLTC